MENSNSAHSYALRNSLMIYFIRNNKCVTQNYTTDEIDSAAQKYSSTDTQQLLEAIDVYYTKSNISTYLLEFVPIDMREMIAAFIARTERYRATKFIDIRDVAYIVYSYNSYKYREYDVAKRYVENEVEYVDINRPPYEYISHIPILNSKKQNKIATSAVAESECIK